jgi:outer membrane biosynthesis protein TonB
VPRIAPEPITAVESEVERPQSPTDNPSTAAPVVVVAGAAPRGASPLFKYAALVGLLGCGGLGIGVWYLATHRKVDTIIVTEPSRRTDDTPITMTDPVTGKTVPVDPKKASSAPARKAAAARPAAAPAKPADNLSGSQKALADLYKDDGDKVTPHLGPNAAAGRSGASTASQPAILSVVSQNRRALTTCYERVLRRDSSLKNGRVVLQVSIGISGRVTSVVIPDAQYASSELGQCFTQAVKRWTFPANDTPYSTEFPFILQGQ